MGASGARIALVMVRSHRQIRSTVCRESLSDSNRRAIDNYFQCLFRDHVSRVKILEHASSLCGYSPFVCRTFTSVSAGTRCCASFLPFRTLLTSSCCTYASYGITGSIILRPRSRRIRISTRIALLSNRDLICLVAL
jgi:hypothetical protein